MVTNGQTPRTHGCIVLGASGNRQGSIKCFDLKSGEVVTRGGFKGVHMPDIVVKLINDLGMQPKKKNRKNQLEFLNRHGIFLDWDNKDIDNDDNVEEFQQKLVHPDIIADIPGVVYDKQWVQRCI